MASLTNNRGAHRVCRSGSIFVGANFLTVSGLADCAAESRLAGDFRLNHFCAVARGRKTLAVLAAIAVIAVVVWFLRPRGYTYQGRTVEAWFKDCAKDQWVENYPSTGEMGPSGDVFRLMGTNAVPFLASRLTRDLTPPWLERWTITLPARFQPTSKHHQAYTAALLLSVCVKPPESMLNELLRPALNSTNDEQLRFVRMACDSCEPVPPLPFTATGNYVTAVVTVLRPTGSRTVQTTNHGQIKMIEDWLQEVKSTQLPLEQLGAVGPWCTVTFYRGSNAVATNEVFAIDGRTTRRELLTEGQRQKLLHIIAQK